MTAACVATRAAGARRLALASLAASLLASACAREPAVTVTVVDEQGAPLRDAAVSVAYDTPAGPRKVERRTGRRGSVRTRGRSASHAVDIYVTKAGHYASSLHRVPTVLQTSAGEIDVEPAVTIGLRPIRHPRPMSARARYDTWLPIADARVGFDLVDGDWVAPYGTGRYPDMLFAVSGYWTSVEDHDLTLMLTFANRDDGLSRFDPHPVSEFVGPYRASDYVTYEPTKRWRRSRRPGADPGRRGPDAVDEVSPWAGYVVRIRTRTELGVVRHALYGTLHGDPEFGPVGEGGVALRLSYCVNPTPNDRNLECDWGKRRGPE